MKSLSPTPVNGQKTNPFAGDDSKYPIKIVLVDDDENDRLQMTREVDQSPDLESVGSFSSGLEALEKIPLSASQVVLMDVRMPGISGIEVTKRLKDVRPGLFIYLISGFDDPHTAAQARQAGAHAYLTKPFSLGRFFETLPDCLRRRKLGVHETHTSRDFSSSGTTETPEPAAVVANSLLPTSDRLQSSAVQRQSRSAGQEQGLLAKPTVRKELLRIVTALENNFHTRQDLLQEAFVYFWSKAQQCPGRELSWYLQGARFHLKNLRRTGRSLDSSKRRAARSQPADNCDRPNESLDAFDLSDDIMSEINARDIHAVLIDRLEPIDQTILVALEEGWASREVAKRLQLSHESVRRHRLKVAAAALKLGIVPLISSQALPL